MNREIVLAAICAIAVIAFAWAIDHPGKALGTLITLLAFAIIAIVVRVRGRRGSMRRLRLFDRTGGRR